MIAYCQNDDELKKYFQFFSVDCGISQSDYDWQNVTYGDFVYQNKALKERLNRVLDPRCNKKIQVSLDE